MKNLVEKIKNSKAFDRYDVFVYAVLLSFIALLFLFFAIFPQSQSPNGFTVTKNGHTVLDFNYDLIELTVEPEYNNMVEVVKHGNQFHVTIYTDAQKTDFNTLFIDGNLRTVVMENSNCPTKKCTHMPAVTNSGEILCAPRDLLISGKTFNPTTGGAQ